MSRAGRKRKIGDRFPAGQIRPEESTASPAAIRRLRDAALMGMADPAWGSVAGLFFLSKKINEVEYQAAKRFGDLHSKYIGVIGGPKQPKTSSGQGISISVDIDVDSDAGADQAVRHVAIMTKYHDAHTALLMVSPAAEAELIRFCAMPGEPPLGYEGVLRVKNGLKALAELWKVRA